MRKLRFVDIALLILLVINFFCLLSVGNTLTGLSQAISALPDKLVVQREPVSYPSAHQIAQQIFEYEHELEARQRLPAVFKTDVAGIGSEFGTMRVYLQQTQGVAEEVTIETPEGISLAELEGINMDSRFHRYRAEFWARNGFIEDWSFELKFLNYAGETETRKFNVLMDHEKEGFDAVRIIPDDT